MKNYEDLVTKGQTLWIDTRLKQEEMDFLWDAISKENKEDHSKKLAGNISRSETLIDKDNWFYESVLKKLTERIFYRNWGNYCRYRLEKEESPPEFEMNAFWVNYQKQHEFNPVHNHSGLFSFVVFMRIPTHWKDQHDLPFSANSNAPLASDFLFSWTKKGSDHCENTYFSLSPEDEGRMLFFPAFLQHQVYPFYECEEERITISGNIILGVQVTEEISIVGGEDQDLYEEKKKMLKMMENSVRITKEELNVMRNNHRNRRTAK